jgi:hypothetical protein
MRAIEGGLQNTWRASAIGIYQNWMAYLQERKAKRRVPVWPVQRISGGTVRRAQAQVASLVDKPVAVP